MIDRNTIAGIAGEQYKRWDAAKSTFRVEHLVDRGKDRELQKAKHYARNVRVKPQTPSAATPPAKTPTKGGPGVDKLVAGSPGEWSKPSALHKPSPPASPFSTQQKGYNQPDLSRNAPGQFGSKQFTSRPAVERPDYRTPPSGMSRYSFPSSPPASATPASPFSTQQKGYNQPDLSRNAPGKFGSKPSALHKPSPPSSPSSSSGGWAARTGRALIAKADEIGQKRASRTGSFSGGAVSHSIGRRD